MSTSNTTIQPTLYFNDTPEPLTQQPSAPASQRARTPNNVPTYELIGQPITDPREIKLRDKMRSVGLSPHLLGYEYLVTAVLMCLDEPKLRFATVHVLYPRVAEHWATSPGAVERCIRHCIEHAFSDGDAAGLYQLCGSCVSAKSGKVNNSAMLAVLVEWMRLHP